MSFDVSQVNYIQNNSQKVVLISNSFHAGDILARKNQKDTGTAGNNILATYAVNNYKIISNNSPSISGDLIHNISELLLNDISIRAP